VVLEDVPAGGTDPGADYVGAATLASLRLPRVALGGYAAEQVDDFRKRAINSVAYLEAKVEGLRAQLQAIRATLDSGLGPDELARGLAFLARAVRTAFDDMSSPELSWIAEELAYIIRGPEEESREHAANFPKLLLGLIDSRQPKVLAGQFVDALAGR